MFIDLYSADDCCMMFLLDNRIFSIDFLSWSNKMRTETIPQCLQARWRVRCSLCFEAKRSADAPGNAKEDVEFPSWKTFWEVLQLWVQATCKKRQRDVDKELFSLQPLFWGQQIKLAASSNVISRPASPPLLQKWISAKKGERGSRNRAAAQSCEEVESDD